MELEALATSLITQWRSVLAVAFLLLATVLLRVRYRPGLRDIPGPFLASILPFHRILTAASGRQFQFQQKLHKKYGSLVRVGPNHVSVSDSLCISQIYGITTKFYKSDFYTLFDAQTDLGVVPTIFSVRDENYHKRLKRPVAHAFSMTSLVELEPMTDVCIKILESKLDEKQGRVIDFGTWLHWYAFDVITSITFSNRLGFMESEKDISGIINAIEGRLYYNSIVGQAPTLHHFLLGNCLVSSVANCFQSVRRLNSARYIVKFAAEQLDRYKTVDKSTDELRDMLARFRLSSGNGGDMTQKELLSHASSNIFAGSDTTAISLRAMFYYLCKNPRCYEKLTREIDEKHALGELSDPVTFAESNEMKYLQTCMKEAMRMHPSCGQLLERVVPENGAEICSVRLPAKTIVGINPWVVARDEAVYGTDADEFRPERWEEANSEERKAMERNFLAFGSGARTCLGKNISLLEMAKVVPQILRKYKVELAEPDEAWRLEGYWFVKQCNVFCKVTRRIAQ